MLLTPFGDPLLPSRHHTAVNKTSCNNFIAVIFSLPRFFLQSILLGGRLRVCGRGTRFKSFATLQSRFLFESDF